MSLFICCTNRENTSSTEYQQSEFKQAGGEYTGEDNGTADIHHAKGLICSRCHPVPIADSLLFRSGHSPADAEVTMACKSCHADASDNNDFHNKHWSVSSSSGTQIPCRACHIANAPIPDSFPFVRFPHKIQRPNISEWRNAPYPSSYCLDCHYNPQTAKNDSLKIASYKKAMHEYYGSDNGRPDIHQTNGDKCTACHSTYIADSLLFRNSHPDDQAVVSACLRCHASARGRNGFHEKHWPTSTNESEKEIPCRVCHIANSPRPDSFPVARIPHKIFRPNWDTDPPFAHSYCADCH